MQTLRYAARHVGSRIDLPDPGGMGESGTVSPCSGAVFLGQGLPEVSLIRVHTVDRLVSPGHPRHCPSPSGCCHRDIAWRICSTRRGEGAKTDDRLAPGVASTHNLALPKSAHLREYLATFRRTTPAARVERKARRTRTWRRAVEGLEAGARREARGQG